MAVSTLNAVVPTTEPTSSPAEVSSPEMCFGSISSSSEASLTLEVPSASEVPSLSEDSSRTEFSSPTEASPSYEIFAPVAVRSSEASFPFEGFSPVVSFSAVEGFTTVDDASSDVTFPDHTSFYREPTPGVPSPAKAQSHEYGTTPEHAAIMAALDARPLPKPTPNILFKVVRDRLFFGREVYLEPEGISQNMLHMIINEGGRACFFSVHADLLCFYSPFFNHILQDGGVLTKATIRSKMLRREWRWEDSADIETMATDIDGTTEVDVRIKLPGEHIRRVHLDNDVFGGPSPIRVFAAFVDWLYKGYHGFTVDWSPYLKYDSDTLIQLWVFAGTIGVPACQNHVIEALEAIRHTTSTINTTMLGWVMENTVDYDDFRGECMLKRLLIDHCAWTMNTDWVMSGGLAADARFPSVVVDAIVERILDYKRANVTLEQEPPFSRLDWRQGIYWVEF